MDSFEVEGLRIAYERAAGTPTSLVIGVVIGLLLLLPLVVLTALGTRRRGNGPVTAFMGGLFFPVTWIIWYLLDEHPYRRLSRRT